MSAHLNVTEPERQTFSKGKLRAISALRNAGLSTDAVLLGKQKIPGRKGRWYTLTTPEGVTLLSPSLVRLCASANDYRLYETTMCLLEVDERINYQRWRADGTAYALALLVSQLCALAYQSAQDTQLAPPIPAESGSVRAVCSWPECLSPAEGIYENRPFCAAHVFAYMT